VADAAEPPADQALGGRVAGRPASSLKIVLLGPPGAGKGTQSEFLARTLGIPAISTGELLREGAKAGGELGARVAAIMTSGGLVDDATMAEVVRERLAQCGGGGGFLLDGYPRTVPQAETLDRILSGKDAGLDGVLLVEVPEEELVRRTLARGREDDREDVVRARLRVYREKTEPLIGYYGGRRLLHRIDGDRSVGEVTSQMLDALGMLGFRS
jgi:adenylate kinase